VAGAAALVRSRYPDLSAPEVVHRLTATATDKGAAGRDPEYGYGVLNLVGALTADVPPLPSSGSPGAGAPGPTPTRVDATTLPNGGGGRTAVFALLGVSLLLLVAAAVTVAVILAARRRRQSPAPRAQPPAGPHPTPGQPGALGPPG
jgi:hypothetical protein